MKWVSKAGRLLCSLFPVYIFDPPFTTGRRLSQIWLTYSEHEGFEMGIRSSHMCTMSSTVTDTEPVPWSSTIKQPKCSIPVGLFPPFGIRNQAGFAHTLALGFGSLWLGTIAHIHILLYGMVHGMTYCRMQHSSGERKMKLSIVYLLLDMTENIGCSSHVPGTFIPLCYRRGCD